MFYLLFRSSGNTFLGMIFPYTLTMI